MADELDSYSPLEISWGRFANMMQIGLGERGHMKLWREGRLEIWGPNGDDLGEPDITFTYEDAEMLKLVVAELESRKEEYEEYLREKAEAADEQALLPLEGKSEPEKTSEPFEPAIPVPKTTEGQVVKMSPQVASGSRGNGKAKDFALV